MRFRRRGFTLIEVLLAGAILTVFMLSLSIMVNTSLRSLGQTRARSQAIRIAQNKLEMVRNLPYEDIGTTGGIPNGPLPGLSTETIGGVNYEVRISVLFVDDPFDGVAPADLLPVDYKRVKVSVSWDGLFASVEPVILLTDATPRGIETAQNQGTLSILVFNSMGQPVSGALVHIEANVTPTINMDVYTDEFGTVLIPGAPICDGCYQITVSKSGYTSDRTYSPSEVASPNNPHMTILNGQVSKTSFAIDLNSSLTVKVTRPRSSNYSPFVGAQFVVRGTKEIGRTADDDPVYKVNRSLVSGTGGLTTINDLEWDNYTILLPDNSSVDYAGSWPLNPISIAPGTNTNATLVVSAATPNSLLIQLLDEQKQPVTNVQAELRSATSISTVSAGVAPNGDQSQIFFSDLPIGNHTFSITGPNYATASGTLIVAGDLIESFTLATPSANP